MDISFCIVNAEGDLVKIALSYYDKEMVKALLDFPTDLTFYDVTLIREIGEGYVSYDLISTVSGTLARFIQDNKDAVLCFYCDANTNVKRNHPFLSPQQYRSELFSKMFERYTHVNHITEFINHRVRIDVDANPMHSQFAHFICDKKHESSIMKIGKILMNSPK